MAQVFGFLVARLKTCFGGTDDTAYSASAKAKGNVGNAGGNKWMLNNPAILAEQVFHAAEDGDASTVKKLLVDGAEVDGCRDGAGWTALIKASVRGHVSVVEVLLAGGADAEVKDQGDGMTALIWATRMGHVDIVTLLLEAGADTKVKDQSGRTAANWAEMDGDAKILELFSQWTSEKSAAARSARMEAVRGGL